MINICQKNEKRQFIAVSTVRMFIEPSALTIATLTDSPYTTKAARIRCYTMLSTILSARTYNIQYMRTLSAFKLCHYIKVSRSAAQYSRNRFVLACGPARGEWLHRAFGNDPACFHHHQLTSGIRGSGDEIKTRGGCCATTSPCPTHTHTHTHTHTQQACIKPAAADRLSSNV